MRGRAKFRRVAFFCLWDGLLLPLHGTASRSAHALTSSGFASSVKKLDAPGASQFGADMPEDLAAVVRVVGVAADGRALAGDADLDGAPVCGMFWDRATAYLRGRVIPSRGGRGVIFFWHWLRTPALSRRTGARVASWVLLGPWRRRARFSGAGARVKQCLALWKANWCGGLKRRRLHVRIVWLAK